MATQSARPYLIVCEFGGTARSGKGTMVTHLAAAHAEVANDETGADYRSLTFALSQQGMVKVGMTIEEIARVLTTIAPAALTDMVASRQQIEATHGFKALYTETINHLVPLLGRQPAVRTAVKAGFAQRIAAVRDDGQHTILVVDGRHLGPVIRTVPGVKLALRVFVSCDPAEAARRECLRSHIALDSPEFETIRQNIARRNDLDANRPLDPMVPDDNALRPTDVANWSTEEFAQAVRSGKQLYLDTTHIPKDAMLRIAEGLLQAALASSQSLVRS